MEKLEFSTNWNNKLDCKVFSTIRIYNASKHYKGNKFEVYLKKQPKGKAEILGYIQTYLKDLTDYVCYLDTGYSQEETTEIIKKIYPKIDFERQYIAVILLKKIEPPKPTQAQLNLA